MARTPASMIGVEEVLPFEELERRVREVRLVGWEGAAVYRTSKIESARIPPERLNLTTGYLLRESLRFQEELRERLCGFGIDTLDLQGLVILKTPEGLRALAPPICENMRLFLASPEQIERGCALLSVDVLIDGAHRHYLGRRNGEDVRTLSVSGVDELYKVPIVPNGWNEVMVVDRLPSREFKKRYLTESAELYRDFSALGSDGYRR